MRGTAQREHQLEVRIGLHACGSSPGAHRRRGIVAAVWTGVVVGRGREGAHVDSLFVADPAWDCRAGQRSPLDRYDVVMSGPSAERTDPAAGSPAGVGPCVDSCGDPPTGAGLRAIAWTGQLLVAVTSGIVTRLSAGSR